MELLTKREKEIVQLIVSGQTSKQISNALFISLDTVLTHRKNINRKLNVHHTAELISKLNGQYRQNTQ